MKELYIILFCHPTIQLKSFLFTWRFSQFFICLNFVYRSGISWKTRKKWEMINNNRTHGLKKKYMRHMNKKKTRWRRANKNKIKNENKLYKKAQKKKKNNMVRVENSRNTRYVQYWRKKNPEKMKFSLPQILMKLQHIGSNHFPWL